MNQLFTKENASEELYERAVIHYVADLMKVPVIVAERAVSSKTAILWSNYESGEPFNVAARRIAYTFSL